MGEERLGRRMFRWDYEWYEGKQSECYKKPYSVIN